jgi:hypothetical protein
MATCTFNGPGSGVHLNSLSATIFKVRNGRTIHQFTDFASIASARLQPIYTIYFAHPKDIETSLRFSSSNIARICSDATVSRKICCKIYESLRAIISYLLAQNMVFVRLRHFQINLKTHWAWSMVLLNHGWIQSLCLCLRIISTTHLCMQNSAFFVDTSLTLTQTMYGLCQTLRRVSALCRRLQTSDDRNLDWCRKTIGLGLF